MQHTRKQNAKILEILKIYIIVLELLFYDCLVFYDYFSLTPNSTKVVIILEMWDVKHSQSHQ
jgi:hypothetical protein